MKIYVPPKARRSNNLISNPSFSGVFISFVLMLAIVSAVSSVQENFKNVTPKAAQQKFLPNQEVLGSGTIVAKKSTPAQTQAVKLISSSQNLQNLPVERNWPVRGRITTYFSNSHTGIDIANKWGTPIHPFASGFVTASGWQGSFGNAITISHNNGYVSTYAHLGKNYVNVGQEVNIQTVIGVVGSTGRATGAHLHFQLTQFGKMVNPLNALP